MQSNKLLLSSSALGLALLLSPFAHAEQKAHDQIKASEHQEEHCDSHKKAEAAKEGKEECHTKHEHKAGASKEDCESHKKDAANKEECHTKHGKDEECDKKDCDTKHKKAGQPAGKHGYSMPKLDSLLASDLVRHVKAMSLNAEQDQQIEKIEAELLQQNQPLLNEIGATGKPLRELYQATPRDINAISQQYSRIFELQQKMLNNVLQADNKAFGLLSEQQREQFSKHRQMMQKMHGDK